eukprot:GHVR01057773.1.p1 GENE.GHVR01057773.1~~GHVR01057773.1.p1  ORF type:complete len:202 (+),score=11.22 GHVR01057773.1:76-681(+)
MEKSRTLFPTLESGTNYYEWKSLVDLLDATDPVWKKLAVEERQTGFPGQIAISVIKHRQVYTRVSTIIRKIQDGQYDKKDQSGIFVSRDHATIRKDLFAAVEKAMLPEILEQRDKVREKLRQLDSPVNQKRYAHSLKLLIDEFREIEESASYCGVELPAQEKAQKLMRAIPLGAAVSIATKLEAETENPEKILDQLEVLMR